MALEGTLRDFSLADIFQLIGIQRKTGVLTLRNTDDVVTVSFQDGSVVSADSQKKKLEDLLGSVLVKSGRISEQQLQEALRNQKRTLQRLGHILIQSRLITHEQLSRALALQVTQVVYRLFRWKDGDYQFTQESAIEYDREHFVPLTAESILMEGIRMIDEWPIIEKKIRSVDMIFSKVRPGAKVELRKEPEEKEDVLSAAVGAPSPTTIKPKSSSDALAMSEGEARIYGHVNGERNVQEIIDRVGLGDFETCRALYDLLTRGIIQEVRKETGKEGPRRPALPSGIRTAASRLAWHVLTAIVILAAAASFASMGLNPLNRIPPAHEDPLFEQVRMSITRSHVKRLDEAVQIYFLQKGFYPDDLSELAKGHLVGRGALRDAWGRSLGYLPEEGGYRIVVYDSQGVERADLSLERRARPSSRAAGNRTSGQ
jgi:hypothetical protein